MKIKNVIVFVGSFLCGCSLAFSQASDESPDTGVEKTPESEVSVVTAVAETETEVVPEPESAVEVTETVEVRSYEPSKRDYQEIPVGNTKAGFYDLYIKDRLVVGTRILSFSLTTTSQGEPFNGSFLGSLNEQEEIQDYAPIYFFVDYFVTPYFGFGISYDQFDVKTLDPGGGDGDFNADGPILYGVVRYPNETRFTPYGEIGFGFYSIEFDPLPEWSEGGRRKFKTDNDVGFVLAAGLDIEIYEGLSFDIYLRYVDVDAEVDYYFQNPDEVGEPNESGTFPMSHFAYGVGVRYHF